MSAAHAGATAALPLLLDVVHAVTTHRRDELTQLVQVSVRRVAPADFFGSVLVDDGQIEAVFIDPPIEPPSTDMSDYYGQRLLERPEVLTFTRADLGAHPVHARLWQDLGVHAGLSVPLLAEARTVGALIYWSKDPRAYENVDREMLDMLGRAVGAAFDNFRAFQALEAARALAEDDYERLVDDVRGHESSHRLIGECAAIRALEEQIAQVGRTSSTVLIVGESGTGKELVARALHEAGPRRAGPFVAINCAALPLSLAESELFGHEEGAFTGAIKRRRGRFELAHGGTLFLDEVGELPLETQTKLLRALQERRIERVGAAESIHVDVRIVAATHRDLATMVAEARFREDLYYRLAVFPMHLPPLRERREDLPRLCEFFIARAAARLRTALRKIDREGMARLEDYDWPGNVRELENAIERAMIVSTGPMLDIDALLPAELIKARRQVAVAAPVAAVVPAEGEREAGLRDEYRQALDECGWVIEGAGGAAARLGVHPNTLRYRLRRLGLVRPVR